MINYILTAFILLRFTITAQQPTIHAFTVLPVNPNFSNQVKIVTHLQTPYSGFLVDKQFTVSANSQTVKLHLCYANGMATVIFHHVDTFAVGQLPQGVWSIQLSAYISSAGQHCARIDSNFTTSSFTVGGVVGVHEFTNSNSFRIYPNPAKDKIVIEPSTDKVIHILSLQGQLLRTCEQSANGEISLKGLPGGMYLIQIPSTTETKTRRIFIQ